MSAFDCASVNWQNVFKELDQRVPGTLTRIADEIKMTKSMLSKIWHRHLDDKDFDPTTMTWGGNNRTFTRKQEEEMTKFMIDGLACDGMAMPEKEIKRICHDHWLAEHGRCTRNSSFTASNGWVYNFKKRNHLSSRSMQSHGKRLKGRRSKMPGNVPSETGIIGNKKHFLGGI